MGKRQIYTFTVFLLLSGGVLALTSPLRFQLFLPNADKYDQVFLQIDGCVMFPLNLSYYDIVNLPSITVEEELTCVDDQLGFFTLKSNWTGIPLYQILAMATITSDAIKVAFFAVDGFSTDLTIEEAMESNIILAYKENGLDLPSFGGGSEFATPFRLIVPGRWGYKWIIFSMETF